jgi:hypothetical protein
MQNSNSNSNYTNPYDTKAIAVGRSGCACGAQKVRVCWGVGAVLNPGFYALVFIHYIHLHAHSAFSKGHRASTGGGGVCTPFSLRFFSLRHGLLNLGTSSAAARSSGSMGTSGLPSSPAEKSC